MAGVSSAGLRNIEALRSTATEDDFFARWSGHQARELTARQKFAELGYVAAALPNLVQLLNAVVVFGVGGMMVMSEDMSIGALMGFYVLAAGFLQPIGRFAKFADAFQVMESNLQRIQDVTAAPEDPLFAVPRHSEPERAATLNGRFRLDGRMEIRNVKFGYRRNLSPLIEDFNLSVAAAKDALIHEEIMSRPGGYSASVDEGGMNFSQGQRQRMEIARALAANPSVMLLDEATSRLDAVTELGIDDALRRRGCTCLIVAHRLSTIRDCDQIVVLDRGRVVQRGTHEELFSDRRGMYYRLVQAE